MFNAVADIRKDASLKEALAELYKDTKLFCRAIFPDKFDKPFSAAIHDPIFEAIDSGEQFVAIAAPRNTGKSSILEVAYPAKRLGFRDAKFIVPISATAALSQRHSENLKNALLTNVRYRQIFGNIKTTDNFGKEMWVCNNKTDDPAGSPLGTVIFPRSFGQQIRGALYGNDRPDLFIIDDLETPEGVFSDDQRMKTKEYVISDVMGSIDRSKNYRIIAIGTVLHGDSFLQNLLDDPNWYSVRTELCDDNLNSNWPEQTTNEELKRIYDRCASLGLLDTFYREYRNICQAAETAPFPRQFQYYEPQELLLRQSIVYFVIVDPATTTNSDSCDTAIVCLGVDLLTNVIYVVDIVAGKLHPNEMAEHALTMCERYRARTLGIETNGLKEYGVWPITNELRRRTSMVEIVELQARRGPTQYVPRGSVNEGKDARIGAALIPLYRTGLIKHNKNHPMTPVMEAQLTGYPRYKRKDIIDAMAHIVSLMHKGERYMFNKKFLPDPHKTFLDDFKEHSALQRLIDLEEPEPEWRANLLH